MSKLKVIYDTDPGVDDAMALLLLARHPGIELLGVTTVFGNGGIDTVTRNALHLKDRFGFAAPVLRGAAGPLNGAVVAASKHVHGENGMGDIPIPAITAVADPRPAAQFIVETVRANPHEVVLIAVGRMTNLALAVALDPGIVKLVKAVSVMGGAFGRNGHTGNVTPVAEANIYGDPEAAEVAFGQDWPLTIVGLDVTMESVMTDEYVAELKRDGGADGQFLWDVSRQYAQFYAASGIPNGFAVHDSSAVAFALHPEMFTTERGQVRVAADGVARGQTILRPEGRYPRAPGFDGRPLVDVCVAVDAPAFLAFYRDTVLGRIR